ncbi:MAG: hypothetical protein ACT4NU_09255 [Chromatiales bacterium]
MPTAPNAILALARAYLDICLFRRGPQDLPASQWLMGVTLGTYALAGFALLSFEFAPHLALLAAVADAGVLWAGTVLLLNLFRHPRRAAQTVTALAGTGLIITVIAIPLAFWLTFGHAPDSDLAVPGVLWLVLFGWNVLVTARVLQQAFSTSFTIALVTAIVFIFLSQQAISVIVPEATGT